MNRENILFAVVGLLLGYVIAFHFVVYVNQSQPVPHGAAEGQTAAAGDLPSDHPALPTNEVKDRQRLQSAAEVSAQAARQDPKSFDAQLKAGGASLDAGKAEEAIDFLTKANQLKPGDYDTLVKLGNANFEAKRLDVAERWYREALAKKPDDVDVRSDLGLTYFLREPPQSDKAVAEFRRVLEYDPEHLPTLHNLTLVLARSGDIEGAEATLARLEKVDPQGSSIPQLREVLDKARKEAPSSSPGAGRGQKKSSTD
jgi:tetratricopeptide (TPR) repeat protein